MVFKAQRVVVPGFEEKVELGLYERHFGLLGKLGETGEEEGAVVGDEFEETVGEGVVGPLLGGE